MDEIKLLLGWALLMLVLAAIFPANGWFWLVWMWSK